jgi:hypothetical protein
MNRRYRKSLLRVRVIFKQNRLFLYPLLTWFLLGIGVFHFAYSYPFDKSLLLALYFGEEQNDFERFYDFWGQTGVVGLIGSFLFNNILASFRPEEVTRLMAKHTKDHYIIIGYSNLGRKLVDYFETNGLDYVVIDSNRESVKSLFKGHGYVIVDDARETDALLDAGVQKAKAVIITVPEIEVALILTKKVRDLMSKNSLLLVRCFNDELVDVLETLGADEVISASKSVFSVVLEKCGCRVQNVPQQTLNSTQEGNGSIPQHNIASN